MEGDENDIEHDALAFVHAPWNDIPDEQSELEVEQNRTNFEALCRRVQNEVKANKVKLNLSDKDVFKAHTGPPLQLRIVDPSRQFPGYSMFLEYDVELPRQHVEKGKGFVDLLKDTFHLHDIDNFGYVQNGVWHTDASTLEILQHLENLQYAFVIIESSRQNFIGEVNRNAAKIEESGLDMVFHELRECNVRACNDFKNSIEEAWNSAKTYLMASWMSEIGSVSGVAKENHEKLGKTLQNMQLAVDAGSAHYVEGFYRLNEDDLAWALSVKQTIYDQIRNLYDKMRRAQKFMDKMVADGDLGEHEIFQMSSRGKEGARNKFVMNYVINPETDEAMWAPPDHTSNYQNGFLLIFLAMAIEREGDTCGDVDFWGGEISKDGLTNGKMVRSPWLPSSLKDSVEKYPAAASTVHDASIAASSNMDAMLEAEKKETRGPKKRNDLGKKEPGGFVILPAKYALLQDLIMNSPMEKANGDRLSKMLSQNPSKNNSRRSLHPSKAFCYGVLDPEGKHTSVTAMPMLASQVAQRSGVKVTIAGNNVLYSSLERPNAMWNIGSTVLSKKPEATKQTASTKKHKRIDRPASKLMGPSSAIEITPLKRTADMIDDTSTVLKKSAKNHIDFKTTETENAVVKAVAEHIQNQNYQSASRVLR